MALQSSSGETVELTLHHSYGKGQHTLSWTKEISLEILSETVRLPPASVNLQQYPQLRFATGGDTWPAEGDELELLSRVLLATTKKHHGTFRSDYDMWAMEDFLGAKPFHSIILSNSDEAMALTLRLVTARPELMCHAHTGQIFTGEIGMHILIVNQREDVVCELLDIIILGKGHDDPEGDLIERIQIAFDSGEVHRYKRTSWFKLRMEQGSTFNVGDVRVGSRVVHDTRGSGEVTFIECRPVLTDLQLKEVFTARAEGKFFQENPQHYFGATPLAYAACFGMKKVIYKMLVTNRYASSQSEGVSPGARRGLFRHGTSLVCGSAKLVAQGAALVEDTANSVEVSAGRLAAKSSGVMAKVAFEGERRAAKEVKGAAHGVGSLAGSVISTAARRLNGFVNNAIAEDSDGSEEDAGGDEQQSLSVLTTAMSEEAAQTDGLGMRESSLDLYNKNRGVAPVLRCDIAVIVFTIQRAFSHGGDTGKLWRWGGCGLASGLELGWGLELGVLG